MQITRFLARLPTQLRGGQRQRVAVARALVMEPAVLLMDEPLSNLDALLRLQMRAELKRLLQEAKTTTVYVTHDQIEALSMGDRTAVMRDGRILQVDTPMMVYDHPEHVFVAQFIGTPPMNVLRGKMGERAVEVEGHTLAVGIQNGFQPGEEITVGVRAENIVVPHESGASCTTTARPVRETSATSVSTSSGTSDRRSSTPAEQPSAASSAAARSHSSTAALQAISVTSPPSRATRARPNGTVTSAAGTSSRPLR